MASGSDLSRNEMTVMLAAMKLAPSAYGASIQSKLEESGLKLSFGSVYAAIKSLERKGFAKTHSGSASYDRGGRPKLYVTVQPSGARALHNMLDALNNLRSGSSLSDDETPSANQFATCY